MSKLAQAEQSETGNRPKDSLNRSWLQRYSDVRGMSERIADPLGPEDCAIQSMPDVSPIRWHLAHTTWFFETFLLKSVSDYEAFDARFEYLFNSYYNTVGEQFPRHRRGLLSRPDLGETLRYRRHVDQAMFAWLTQSTATDQQLQVLEIGLNHEQQHQELMLTDIKHVLSCNPTDPVYRSDDVERTLKNPAGRVRRGEWIDFDEQLVWVGADGDQFTFDNERPRHRFFLEPYCLANLCVTNREYLEFIEDGGYRDPRWWLSAGWQTVQEQNWSAPLYWQKSADGWTQFTLSGRQEIVDDQPVCHVSYFEADAFARWSGCRLPTEQEWEHAIASDLASSNVSSSVSHAATIATSEDDLSTRIAGHWSDVLMDAGKCVHPQISQGNPPEARFVNALGNAWQWTSSQYTGYPGYQAPPGALGEYNGKFMCNQFVMRGGSCATPSRHARYTYRNFFPPQSRWQFTTLRLAK